MRFYTTLKSISPLAITCSSSRFFLFFKSVWFKSLCSTKPAEFSLMMTTGGCCGCYIFITFDLFFSFLMPLKHMIVPFGLKQKKVNKKKKQTTPWSSVWPSDEASYLSLLLQSKSSCVAGYKRKQLKKTILIPIPGEFQPARWSIICRYPQRKYFKQTWPSANLKTEAGFYEEMK